MRTAVAIAALVLAAGCAHDVLAHYPRPPDELDPPGSLTFVLTEAGSDISVAVNGVLLVHDARTSHITIDNLPSGNVDVVVAAGPSEKAMRIWIDSGKETTVPLGSPGPSSLEGWRASIVSLAGVALYALLLRH
jgi:hypothetical protein